MCKIKYSPDMCTTIYKWVIVWLEGLTRYWSDAVQKNVKCACIAKRFRSGNYVFARTFDNFEVFKTNITLC